MFWNHSKHMTKIVVENHSNTRQTRLSPWCPIHVKLELSNHWRNPNDKIRCLWATTMKRGLPIMKNDISSNTIKIIPKRIPLSDAHQNHVLFSPLKNSSISLLPNWPEDSEGDQSPHHPSTSKEGSHPPSFEHHSYKHGHAPKHTITPLKMTPQEVIMNKWMINVIPPPLA